MRRRSYDGGTAMSTTSWAISDIREGRRRTRAAPRPWPGRAQPRRARRGPARRLRRRPRRWSPRRCTTRDARHCSPQSCVPLPARHPGPSPSASASAAASADASAAVSARARPMIAPPRRAAPSDSTNPIDDDGDHENRHAPALGAPSLLAHRSTRMVADACRSGSGNSTPTSGRFVRVVVLHGDGDLVADSRASCRRRPSRPGGVRRAARAAAPGSRSTLAARAASRAAWTTPIWSRTTSPTWMTARAASTISGSRKANSTVA